MKQGIIWGLITILLILSKSEIAFAKVLPRFAKQPVKTTGGGSSTGIYVKPTLRSDRQALSIYMSGLSKAKAVSYMLIYRSAGVDKGAGGSIDLSNGDAVNRELLFGTESSGVYHYDDNITNMKFEVTTELQSGKKTLKRFKIKI